MSPLQGDLLYRDREQIIEEILTAFVSRIPQVFIEEDSQIRMFTEVYAGLIESVYQAEQLISEDMFIATANIDALLKYGTDYDVALNPGVKASGDLLFQGAGGTYIPAGTQVAHDPAVGLEPLYFFTDTDGTVPNPGTPSAPATTDLATSGNLTGLMEYVITFVTAEGETLPGDPSVALSVSASRIHLSSISIGGSGTTARKIYRQKDGFGYKYVATIANNTATTYDDNVADGSLGGEPPTASSAERVTISGIAEDVGTQYNVVAGGITILVDVPDGINAVTNAADFSSGSNDEDFESYRQRLLIAVQSPGTGSPNDLKTWAEEIPGVESATVFPNFNGTTATNGHVTIRISGPGGTVPGAPVIAAVLAAIQDRGLADITYHIATFTPNTLNVTADVTVSSGLSLGDVTPSVTDAITTYINGLEAGATFYLAGAIDAIYGLPGVEDVTITTPGANATQAATQKFVVGTITVS